MPCTREDVTSDFDHHCPASVRDPDETYRDMLERCPVAWTHSHGGFWIVTRYEDVIQVLRDYQNFSSRDGMAIPAHKGMDYGIPVQLDPPEHKVYRRVMNPYMTSEAVRSTLLPRLQHWTAHYIDRVIERGSCDFAYDIAIPIPGAVTLEWLGWEQCDEWDRISQAWHDLLAYPLDHPNTHRSHQDLAWFTRRVAEQVDQRRREPRDDIMSQVANLQIDGELIPRQHAVSLITVWVGGGVDTTTTFILGGLLHLHRNPDHQRRLREEPALWDTAIDEILRRYPPTRTTTRTVVKEVTLGGCVMKPGDRILVSLSGANLDSRQFQHPDEVLLERRSNQHVAFGLGAHRCVGMHLARQEFRVVVGEILQRMPDFRLDEQRITAYERQSEMRGWTSMPGTFTPRPRRPAAA